MTKIDIFSGFLGAGKTTLIKKLINEAFQGEKLVLIENEFGEIGIDGGFLKDAGIEITEMNSGCICCSLVGDFGTALKEVLEKYTPDRIIIEPSGVGKLSDVIKAVEDVAKDTGVKINGIVTVADATKCKMYMKNFGEFYNNQIEYSKTIVLSRTQTMKEEKLENAVTLIQEKNKCATIITTSWDDINGKKIVAAMEQQQNLVQEMMQTVLDSQIGGCGHHHEDHDHHHEHEEGCCCGHDHEDHHHHHEHEEGCCCGHDHEDHHHHHEHGEECCCGHHHEHHHHHADDVFTSWGIETPRKYTKEGMQVILEKLANTKEYGMILRAKGIVPSESGEWIYFDLVPGEYELRTGGADVTGKLCVVGTNLKEEELKTLFSL